MTVNSVQSLSRVWLFATPQTTACQASLSITSSQSLPKLMSIESVMPSNHFILGRPLLLLPLIFASIRVFSNESVLHIRWPKYWSFSFNISPSNEHPGPNSFRMDWLDLLAVQGTRKTVLQHHSSKASILRGSAFFIVQLSHTYMTTGKTIVLTRWTFVDKVMSLLFNVLSRLVITFLPRSKRLLISLLQSPSAVILEPTWPTSWETYMQVRKLQLELDMEQQTGSKLGKEYLKAVCCHSTYLTYMQSTSREILGRKKHKLESRLLGEISITSDMQETPPLWQKWRRSKESLDESERREWKSPTFRKLRSWHLVPSLHGK